RATGAATVVAVLAALALHDRRAALRFAVGVLPVPLLVGAYNWHYFGSPLVFAQELVGRGVAVEKTGSPDLWQTPFFEGLIGLLASPSRGLLVFSPLLGLAFAGMVVAARSKPHRDLLPFAAGAAAMMAAQCKWFDWWGGWTYGYRPWLDALPALTLLIVPVIDRVTATPLRRAAVAALLGWSAFVQGLGALAYDHSWNLRVLFVVRRHDRPGPEAFITEAEARSYADRHRGEYLGHTMCNIDLPFCRYRLWSVSDNTIEYHVREFALTRSRRLPASFAELGRPLDPAPPP
ncbi:MAG: hypothetical protein FJ104_02280, partial [Deltaproteobacteria bacterium]|nr:hypothetical protein [Deltaproteobacteria bacterium]